MNGAGGNLIADCRFQIPDLFCDGSLIREMKNYLMRNFWNLESAICNFHRSSRLRILPVAVIGKVSRNSTKRGYL